MMASDVMTSRLSEIPFPLDPALLPPLDNDREPPKSRSPTPGALDEQEIQEMRAMALEAKSTHAKGKGKEDPRELELVDMVLRLTAALPSRSQVLDQAATISRLSQQQDFLLKRMNDERDVWDAERDSMYRISEALMAQANMSSHTIYKEQENVKRPGAVESENASLRHKLADAHSRMSSLEAELSQLRPLLLMQPHAIALAKGFTLPPGRPRKKEGTANEENRSYYRVREEKTSGPQKSRKKRAAAFKHAPTVADARSEHLLLAARKLGKERATMVSQAMYRTADVPHPAPLPMLAAPGKGKERAEEGQPPPSLDPGVWPQAHDPKPRVPGASRPQQPQFHQLMGNPGMPYPPPPPAQQYLVPSSSVARPGAPIHAHAFYHTQSRGYIPGPAWPYYTPAPYAFGPQFTIPGGAPNARPVRLTSVPLTAGPSRAPSKASGPTPNVGKVVSAAPPVAANTATGPSSKTVLPGGSRQPSEASQQIQKTPQSKANHSNGPPTPMDSLLSAAHSVFSPGSGASNSAGTQESHQAREVADVESPIPAGRRRRTDAAARADDAQRTSALDVLADQAVFGPSSRRSRSRSVSPINDDGDVGPLDDFDAHSSPSSPISSNRKRKRLSGSAANSSLTPASATAAGTSRATTRSRFKAPPQHSPYTFRTSSGALSGEKEDASSGLRKGKQPERLSKHPPPQAHVTFESTRASRSSTKASAAKKVQLKGKQPARPPPTRATLMPQRSANGEEGGSNSRLPAASQISSASFRLRPVQAGAFARNDDTVQAGPPRSTSVPHHVFPPQTTVPTRDPHSSAVLPPDGTRSAPAFSPAIVATPITAADADVEAEDELESDEEEEDQLQDEDDEPSEQTSGLTQSAADVEEANRRRWLKILGPPMKFRHAPPGGED